MKRLLALFVVLSSVAAEAVTYTVSHVTVQQRWPWSQKVDIDYALDASDGSPADIAVSFWDGSTALPVPSSALSGDVLNVAPGFRRITLDPQVAGLPATTYASFNVQLTAQEVALYLVVDLTKQKGEPGQVTRISRSALESGVWGSCETNPVPGIASVAWTGVTNDPVYATSKYVLRRISPGTFMMGANNKNYSADYVLRTNQVTLTRTFYIGVFETTQKQWEYVMGSAPSSFFTLNGDTRPADGVTYAQVRGKNVAWPADGYGRHDSGTFLQRLCDLTGLCFDLPTFAQWQYASGGTLSTWFNTGTNPPDAQHFEWSPEADVCARYLHTAGTEVPLKGDYTIIDVDRGTAKVGSYRCNAYGLYDMHGNVWEFLLDYANGSYDYPEVCTDPVGSPSGTNRMWAGGSFQRQSKYIRLAFRGGYDIPLESTNETYKRESGFRVIMMP